MGFRQAAATWSFAKQLKQQPMRSLGTGRELVACLQSGWGLLRQERWRTSCQPTSSEGATLGNEAFATMAATLGRFLCGNPPSTCSAFLPWRTSKGGGTTLWGEEALNQLPPREGTKALGMANVS